MNSEAVLGSGDVGAITPNDLYNNLPDVDTSF